MGLEDPPWEKLTTTGQQPEATTLYQDFFPGPSRKMKSQDNHHTSELLIVSFIAAKELSLPKAVQRAINMNTPKEEQHAWHSSILH